MSSDYVASLFGEITIFLELIPKSLNDLISLTFLNLIKTSSYFSDPLQLTVTLNLAARLTFKFLADIFKIGLYILAFFKNLLMYNFSTLDENFLRPCK